MRRAAIFLLLLFTGCFRALVPDDGSRCLSDDNCPSGQVCDALSGRCTAGAPDVSCSRHQDCPLESICESGVCVEGCVESGDCGLDRDCIDGFCGRVSECRSDAVCPFGQSCNLSTGRCEPHRDAADLCDDCHEPRLCLTDADCGGTFCVRPDLERYGLCEDCGAGECYYLGGDTSCSSDDQCGDGAYCFRAACVTDPYCADQGWGSCGNAVRRGGGPVAEGTGNCTAGVCVRSFCGSGDCDDTGVEAPVCPRGYTCFSLIAIPETSRCTQDVECGPSSHCRRINEADDTKFCACTNDSECPEGSRCDDGGCLTSRSCQPALGLTCEEVRP